MHPLMNRSDAVISSLECGESQWTTPGAGAFTLEFFCERIIVENLFSLLL